MPWDNSYFAPTQNQIIKKPRKTKHPLFPRWKLPNASLLFLPSHTSNRRLGDSVTSLHPPRLALPRSSSHSSEERLSHWGGYTNFYKHSWASFSCKERFVWFTVSLVPLQLLLLYCVRDCPILKRSFWWTWGAATAIKSYSTNAVLGPTQYPGLSFSWPEKVCITRNEEEPGRCC